MIGLKGAALRRGMKGGTVHTEAGKPKSEDSWELQEI